MMTNAFSEMDDDEGDIEVHADRFVCRHRKFPDWTVEWLSPGSTEHAMLDPSWYIHEHGPVEFVLHAGSLELIQVKFGSDGQITLAA